MSTLKTYKHNAPFQLENGSILPELEVGYHTYGQLNTDKTNAVWICHALTANSDVAEWWDGLVGDGKIFNPDEHFIVCANFLSGCYGTTGPKSINPETNKPYYGSFPAITIRDMVEAHKVLQQHLGINKIEVGVGGSMGGYQILEWMIQQPELFTQSFLIATSPKESPWGIGIHTAHRMAMELDPTWNSTEIEGGKKGIQAARAIGMMSYRTYNSFCIKQDEESEEKISDFKAESYIRYQGKKLSERFNPYAYWNLLNAMDTHNIARGRGLMENVLANIKIPTLIIGIDGDLLCPLREQRFMAEFIPNSTLVEIESDFGHDGFLMEAEKITKALKQFLKK